MHNWWLASLEHFGLVTREQAEHIATEIKNSIHKDQYVEAYNDLGAILDKNKIGAVKTLEELDTRFLELKADLEEVKTVLETLKSNKVASPKKP